VLSAVDGTLLQRFDAGGPMALDAARSRLCISTTLASLSWTWRMGACFAHFLRFRLQPGRWAAAFYLQSSCARQAKSWWWLVRRSCVRAGDRQPSRKMSFTSEGFART